MTAANPLKLFLHAAVAAVVASSSAVGGDGAAIVETLSATFTGRVETLGPNSLFMDRVDESDRSASIALRDVVTIRWPGTRRGGADRATVEFADGSTFAYDAWELRDGRPAWRTESGEGLVAAPFSDVRAWRLPDGAPPEDLWRELARRSPNADLLVIRRRSGDVDYVDGVVERVEENALFFALAGDPDPIEVPWPRVYGVVFSRPAVTGDVAEPTAVVRGADNLSLRAEQLTLEDGVVRLQSGPRRAELPLGSIASIDLSAGKIRWLGEAEVLHSNWRPFDDRGLPAVGGPPRRNESYDGRPLRLSFRDERTDDGRITRSFATGWAIRSRGEVVLRLPPWARRLRGWVGVDPATAASGDAEVSVYADDSLTAQFRVAGDGEPIDLDAVVAGASSVRLVVDYGDNLDTGDNVHFADLRVTR